MLVGGIALCAFVSVCPELSWCDVGQVTRDVGRHSCRAHAHADPGWIGIRRTAATADDDAMRTRESGPNAGPLDYVCVRAC